jgi:hypothetical protein
VLFNDVDRDLCSLIFNGLMRLDAHGLPQPDLAARPPEISPDGLVTPSRCEVTSAGTMGSHTDDVLFFQPLKTLTFRPRPAELWRTVEVSRVNAS